MASTSTSGRGEQEDDPFLVLEPSKKMIKSSLTAKQYDVFINHRGPDTKTNLAQQLYDSLQEAEIRAYLDAPETELGDYFPSAIKNAISSAAVHIAILSPGYAESAWCLAELALMFQTRARIIPLFYNVEPSDFRYIKNGVADAFSKHEDKGRYPQHDIQQWKECLQNVSGIKGYEINGQNDDLSRVCSDVVCAVVKEKQKRKIPLRVAKYVVGLDELVKDFHSHCERDGQMRDKIIGIFGMGGSGKTTLAKDLFNRKHSKFSGSTILFDVRQNDVKGALTSLQSKLLNDLFRLKDKKTPSTEEGIAIIKDNLQKSPESSFLIVIDDADHQKQLDALLPIDALNHSSLVIVTTRDERLLIQAGVRVRYKLKEMNPEDSKELFCWHAFHRQSCKCGFENLVDSFVKTCGGLPLALRVMGGHVFGSDKPYWKLQLDDVKASLHKDIKDTLKISYDTLEKDQKQIFMDIACFFIGQDVSRAISIWKASGWKPKNALQTLKDKCLVEVETYFERMHDCECHYELKFDFRMHDHLRDLGREMADNEMSHPRRLWCPKDLIRTSEIKGFQDILVGSEGKSFRCSNRIRNFQSKFDMTYFLGSSQTSTDSQWLHLKCYSKYDLWSPLQNLDILRLEQVLVKVKELSYTFDCHEDIIAEWNWLLKSVRELTNLQTLELTCFTLEGEFALSNRGEISDERFRMRSLESITLCDALKTTNVSISGQFCPAIKSLKLCSMTDLIEVDLTGVTTLEYLVLLKCRELRKVLANDLLQLEIFRIKLCESMRELPNFGRVSCLRRMYISRCEKLQDISAIERLKGLERIWIAYCPELKNIKAIEQLKELKRIWIQDCTQLEGVICLKELKELKRIFIGHCARLQSIEGIEFLIRLESIIITACPKLHNIRSIEEMERVKEMIISDSPIVSCVQKLQRLPSELTILVGRLEDEVGNGDSYFNAEKIGDTLSMADGFCEMNRPSHSEVLEMIRSFQARHSPSTLIFCSVVWGRLSILSDICNGTKIKNLKYTSYEYLRNAPLSSHNNWVIYTCVVNEEMISKYDFWKPQLDTHLDCYPEKVFLMGVKAGKERKTLHILQSLFAQPCVDNSEYSDDPAGYYEVEDDDPVGCFEGLGYCEDLEDHDPESFYEGFGYYEGLEEADEEADDPVGYFEGLEKADEEADDPVGYFEGLEEADEEVDDPVGYFEDLEEADDLMGYYDGSDLVGSDYVVSRVMDYDDLADHIDDDVEYVGDYNNM